MFDKATSEAKDSDKPAKTQLPEVCIPSDSDDDVTYAPSIMLYGSSTAESANDERRIRDRTEYDVAVYVRYDDEEFVGLCGDISDRGLFVATSRIPPRSSLVDLEFLMPGSDEEFVLEAEVRWVREEWDEQKMVVPGFGVQFLDVSDRERALLDKVLASGSTHQDDE